MRISVLFDEHSVDNKLQTGFGFSALINNSVLFDVGTDGSAVVNNMRVLGIGFQSIEAVVLSHEHWDHTDGLEDVLSVLENPAVYVCPGVPRRLKKRIGEAGATMIECGTPAHVCEGVFTTGEMRGEYKGGAMPEQSLLAAYGDDRAAVISGCAHYGIARGILELQTCAARVFGGTVALDTVAGGLHLSHESDEAITGIAGTLHAAGVRAVAPVHCSGSNGRRMFASQPFWTFHDLRVGSTLEQPCCGRDEPCESPPCT
ncbi:MAG: MBL fold metallo-hydrolase [Chitinivibrionales bacterium]|nr:MBL fold metallo-hydrolase [Chitinivibrionales bacterium]MBD3396883.1 MBL fold metallo-hydrolase [Chitinivibrionales bacterium]